MTETEKDIKALDNAIDAMEKIKKVIAKCREQEELLLIGCEGFEWSDGYVSGRQSLSIEVLKILEAEIE
jgi:hypothetical protein